MKDPAIMDQDEKERLRDTVKVILADGASGGIEDLMSLLARMADDAARRVVPGEMDRYFEQLGFSEEVAGLSALLAAKSGDSRDNVLRKALTLYGLALDAVLQGNKLAILTPDDEVVQDIEGITTQDDIPEPVSGRAGG